APGSAGPPSCRAHRRRPRGIDMRKQLIASVAAMSLLAGCAVGPNYQRPAVQVPQAFRTPEPAAAPEPASLADLKWFEVFKDAQLQDLIKTALAQNYDLRDAVARVEAARANGGTPR